MTFKSIPLFGTQKLDNLVLSHKTIIGRKAVVGVLFMKNNR